MTHAAKIYRIPTGAIRRCVGRLVRRLWLDYWYVRNERIADFWMVGNRWLSWRAIPGSTTAYGYTTQQLAVEAAKRMNAGGSPRTPNNSGQTAGDKNNEHK